MKNLVVLIIVGLILASLQADAKTDQAQLPRKVNIGGNGANRVMGSDLGEKTAMNEVSAAGEDGKGAAKDDSNGKDSSPAGSNTNTHHVYPDDQRPRYPH
ncbi:hypothetical protein NE237_031359 [Protea cynaroides]|uniref:Uncharacterized protein n=1 Tax=Protea cynaroides TaxID=273540 RepID=A0A9Q0L1A7_9MAGN|nr:hypothetical protein NE237_031359 [Protea cynaroides]